MLAWSEIEEGLVAWAKAGDQEAFEELMARYERQIYSFIYRLMGDADDAYDLTQDTFVKAYRALGGFARDGRGDNVSAWLHRIANNLCLDVLRRRQRLRFLPWEGPKHDQLLVSPPMDDPERSAMSQETRALVWTVLNQMSAHHRRGLILREMQGLDCYEIADVIGMSRSAVKSMLHRARAEFRLVYSKMGHEPLERSGICYTALNEKEGRAAFAPPPAWHPRERTRDA